LSAEEFKTTLSVSYVSDSQLLDQDTKNPAEKLSVPPRLYSAGIIPQGPRTNGNVRPVGYPPLQFLHLLDRSRAIGINEQT
jgi:hypothetical protein